MNKLKYLSVVLFLAFTTFALKAQIKKTPIKKQGVTVKKAKVPVVKKTIIPAFVGTRVKFTTDSGVIIFRLYDSTPLHRDNFIKLVKAHFYDSLLFHRVIKNFMIQGGDPLSKNAQSGQMLGMGGGDMERIPAEFRTSIIHKKGALAAARDGNPEKASSACQFYIVQGKKFTDDELNGLEMQLGRKYTPEQRLIYKTIGGTPFLDMNYTVFGEIESGLKIIDKIANTQTAPGDRPINDIRMKIEILK